MTLDSMCAGSLHKGLKHVGMELYAFTGIHLSTISFASGVRVLGVGVVSYRQTFLFCLQERLQGETSCMSAVQKAAVFPSFGRMLKENAVHKVKLHPRCNLWAHLSSPWFLCNKCIYFLCSSPVAPEILFLLEEKNKSHQYFHKWHPYVLYAM